MHKVYLVEPKYSYDGKGLVAADSAVQANEIIDDFIRQDNSNVLDSWGYNHVGKCDCVEHLYSDEIGIILYGIHYTGVCKMV